MRMNFTRVVCDSLQCVHPESAHKFCNWTKKKNAVILVRWSLRCKQSEEALALDGNGSAAATCNPECHSARSTNVAQTWTAPSRDKQANDASPEAYIVLVRVAQKSPRVAHRPQRPNADNQKKKKKFASGKNGGPGMFTEPIWGQSHVLMLNYRVQPREHDVSSMAQPSLDLFNGEV